MGMGYFLAGSIAFYLNFKIEKTLIYLIRGRECNMADGTTIFSFSVKCRFTHIDMSIVRGVNFNPWLFGIRMSDNREFH